MFHTAPWRGAFEENSESQSLRIARLAALRRSELIYINPLEHFYGPAVGNFFFKHASRPKINGNALISSQVFNGPRLGGRGHGSDLKFLISLTPWLNVVGRKTRRGHLIFNRFVQNLKLLGDKDESTLVLVGGDDDGARDLGVAC